MLVLAQVSSMKTTGQGLNAVGPHASSRARRRRPAAAARRHEATFFERQPARSQKTINRRTPNVDAVIADRLVQFIQCQVWPRCNQLSNQSLMSLKRIRLLAAWSRRNGTCASEPLHQLDHAAHADRKLPSRRVPRNSTLNRRHDPTAQIFRIRSPHACWPPPSSQLESYSRLFGNPLPIPAIRNLL